MSKSNDAPRESSDVTVDRQRSRGNQEQFAAREVHDSETPITNEVDLQPISFSSVYSGGGAIF